MQTRKSSSLLLMMTSPEDASLFKQLYNKNAENLFKNFIEKGKESRTLYRDTLHLMGMRMTDGTEE